MRGEICIVVAGAEPASASLDGGIAQVQALVTAGASLKDAAAEVAEATGLGRRDLYQGALARK